jgi:hypothetical protein
MAGQQALILRSTAPRPASERGHPEILALFGEVGAVARVVRVSGPRPSRFLEARSRMTAMKAARLVRRGDEP